MNDIPVVSEAYDDPSAGLTSLGMPYVFLLAAQIPRPCDLSQRTPPEEPSRLWFSFADAVISVKTNMSNKIFVFILK